MSSQCSIGDTIVKHWAFSRHENEKWKCSSTRHARHKLDSAVHLPGGRRSNTHPPVFIYSLRNLFLMPSWTCVQGSKMIPGIIRILAKREQEMLLRHDFHPFGHSLLLFSPVEHTRLGSEMRES